MGRHQGGALMKINDGTGERAETRFSVHRRKGCREFQFTPHPTPATAAVFSASTLLPLSSIYPSSCCYSGEQLHIAAPPPLLHQRFKRENDLQELSMPEKGVDDAGREKKKERKWKMEGRQLAYEE